LYFNESNFRLAGVLSLGVALEQSGAADFVVGSFLSRRLRQCRFGLGVLFIDGNFDFGDVEQRDRRFARPDFISNPLTAVVLSRKLIGKK
jgi:hypothetical protein